MIQVWVSGNYGRGRLYISVGAIRHEELTAEHTNESERGTSHYHNFPGRICFAAAPIRGERGERGLRRGLAEGDRTRVMGGGGCTYVRVCVMSGGREGGGEKEKSERVSIIIIVLATVPRCQ